MKYTIFTTALIGAAATALPLAAQNRIDGQADNAPELAAYGDYTVGVQQFDFVNPDQIDIVNIDAAADPADPLPIYDRPLTVEMWYPAVEGATGETTLNAYIRDGITEVELEGQAIRDAAPDATGSSPLVILSHGYPGNRFLVSHLAENLASKGYVVASIDHTDSTYRDQNAFSSTLVNRSLDQLFVLDEIAKINEDPTSAFAGLIDTDNTGIIGYSMGGYGALVTTGAGITEGAASIPFISPQGVLTQHQTGSATHEALPDDRIKTAIAIGPYGRDVPFLPVDLFDAEGLAGVDVPLLLIAGSNDETSGYETGVRAIWEETTGTDRALLTFDGGSHNTVAPIPAPEESFYDSAALGFNVSEHYTDPVWDTVFMNNVGQHFATAWLDVFLKGEDEKTAYLDLVDIGSDGLFSTNADGSFADDHTYWAGFEDGAAEGLRFERLAADPPAPVPLPASIWLLGLAVGGLGAARKLRGHKG